MMPSLASGRDPERQLNVLSFPRRYLLGRAENITVTQDMRRTLTCKERLPYTTRLRSARLCRRTQDGFWVLLTDLYHAVTDCEHQRLQPGVYAKLVQDTRQMVRFCLEADV
jgi:hypothetical protein